MTIRPADQNDIDEWLRLRLLLWPGDRQQHLDEIVAFFEGKSVHIREVFVAIDQDRLTGFIELNIRSYAEGSSEAEVPYVEGWYVETGYRRQGIGQELMEAAEQWVTGLGYHELASDAEIENDHSIAAHKALGFRETDRQVCFIKALPGT